MGNYCGNESEAFILFLILILLLLGFMNGWC